MDRTPVTLSFHEIPELRSLIEDIERELQALGVEYATLQTRSGTFHLFEVKAPHFQVTDHLQVQPQVRCQVCTVEPALRYDFRVQDTAGAWVGPIGSTCLFTAVLGKEKAVRLGRNMQHQAARYVHVHQQRKLLATTGNHYQYLKQLGLTWIHRPTAVGHFDLPRRLQDQFRQVLQGGIVELELFDFLQELNLDFQPAPAPPRSTGPKIKKPSNVIEDDFVFWTSNQPLLEEVFSREVLDGVNLLLVQHSGAALPEKELNWFLLLVYRGELHLAGKTSLHLPAEGLAVWREDASAVLRHLLPADQRHFKEQLSHFGRSPDQHTRFLLGKALGRMQKQIPVKTHSPEELDHQKAQIQSFWQHVEGQLHALEHQVGEETQTQIQYVLMVFALKQRPFDRRNWALKDFDSMLRQYSDLREDFHLTAKHVEQLHKVLHRRYSAQGIH